jgi:hypothetical protein
MTPAILGVVVWQIQITLIIAFAPERTWMTLPTLEIAALPTQDNASALEITLISLVKVRLPRICCYWESKMISSDSLCQNMYVSVSFVK